MPYDAGGVTGTGCTSDDGDVLTLDYTSHGIHYPTYFETGTCKIPLPFTSGVSNGAYCMGTWTVSPGDHTNSFGQDIALRICDVNVPK